MIDFFHEAIDATVIVVSNPREKVVDGFFQGMLGSLEAINRLEKV